MADEKDTTETPEPDAPVAEAGDATAAKPKRAAKPKAAAAKAAGEGDAAEAKPKRARAAAEPKADATPKADEAKPKRTRAAAKPKAEAEVSADAEAPKDEAKAEPEAAAEAKPRRARAAKPKAEAGAAAPTRPVVRAQAKYVRSSARKARIVCDHLRGKSVEDARAILAFTPRAVARDWSKVLESAVANAEHNHELVGEDLVIKAAHADEGPTLKRFRPRAMGRATPIRKRTSHLTILLTPKE